MNLISKLYMGAYLILCTVAFSVSLLVLLSRRERVHYFGMEQSGVWICTHLHSELECADYAQFTADTDPRIGDL